MKKIKQFIAVFLVLAMSITGIELSGVKAHAGLYDYYYRAHCVYDDAYENSSKEWGSFFYNGVFYDVSKWDEDRRDHKIVIPGSNEHAFE